MRWFLAWPRFYPLRCLSWHSTVRFLPLVRQQQANPCAPRLAFASGQAVVPSKLVPNFYDNIVTPTLICIQCFALAASSSEVVC